MEVNAKFSELRGSVKIGGSGSGAKFLGPRVWGYVANGRDVKFSKYPEKNLGSRLEII